MIAVDPNLPGAELVGPGLKDLERRAETVNSLLVSIASRRLRDAGLPVATPLPDPELRLYDLLSREHGDAAHARMNALVRRLVSFERALACAR
ncbi:MAG TPA: hypothetical protein VE777_21600 [Gaiellales bacterium]|nr:hypothetical protein [Gaiellales bacterium]